MGSVARVLEKGRSVGALNVVVPWGQSVGADITIEYCKAEICDLTYLRFLVQRFMLSVNVMRCCQSLLILIGPHC